MNHYYRIPNELLKNGSYNFKQFLLVFLNRILEDGSVPEALNKGKCMLIFKVNYQKLFPKTNQNALQGGDSLQPSQYRPITIPSNLLRLVTVRMCGLMSSAAEKNHLLGNEQFGFRRGRSTLDATFVLTTLLRKAKAKR